MEPGAVERAKERLEERAATAALEEALERARARVERLAEAAETAAAALPERLETAVQDALREQVVPVARNLAEIRGLLNQVIRRVATLEDGAVADRHARVDDLALLVELVSAGWEGVDARLARLEALVNPALQDERQRITRAA